VGQPEAIELSPTSIVPARAELAGDGPRSGPNIQRSPCFDCCQLLVTGCDDDYVYLHNPDVDHSRQRESLDCQHLPISHVEFQRMSAFGLQRVRAAVMVRTR